MKLSPSVKKELGHIALGVAIGDVLMLGVFALLNRLDYTVLLGAALGSAAAIGNFLFMCVAVQKAMEDPDRAKSVVQGSYGKRMFVMLAVMILGIALKTVFHPVAVLLPFLMPGLTIRIMSILGLVKPEKKGGAETTDES